MTGIFVFAVIMVLVAVSVVVWPDAKPSRLTIDDRLRALRERRKRHRERLRELEEGPRTRAADIEDEEQVLFLIESEIDRLEDRLEASGN